LTDLDDQIGLPIAIFIVLYGFASMQGAARGSFKFHFILFWQSWGFALGGDGGVDGLGSVLLRFVPCEGHQKVDVMGLLCVKGVGGLSPVVINLEGS
jgi:hypothetical protein